jgi:PiT family inorganic phosphate transporter
VETLALIVTIAVALAFTYTNGFHDSANAIALSVSTRALTPKIALLMAAVLNLVGALISTHVAKTVGEGIIEPPRGNSGLVLVFAALIGAILWNLVTWYFGLPSSSSHALIGGLIGAALAHNWSTGSVKWSHVVDKVIVPMIASPLVGAGLGFLVMFAILWIFRNRNPHRLHRGFRRLQILSAAAISFSHGTQDAQKTMGVIALALFTGHHIDSFYIPLWVKFAAAAALALGTYSGGKRSMRTLGRPVNQVDPPRG